jgi:hypothetical protein
MPLMYLVSAAARLIGGTALLTEWLVVAIAFAVSAACTTMAAARLSRSVAIALFVVALEILINTRSFGYPKILLYAVAAVLIINAARRPTRGSIAALGAITVVGFLFRHDHGLFIGVPAFVTMVAGGYAEGPRVAVRRAAALLGWVLVMLLPWAIYVQVEQGIVQYFASALGFWRSEASGMTLQTLPSIEWSAIDSSANGVAWLFFFFHALPFICLALVARRHARRREACGGESVAVTALCVMAIGVNASFMRESLQARIPDAVVPAALLGAWLLGLAVHASVPRRMLAVAGAAVVAAITTGAVVRAADVDEQLDRTRLLEGPASVTGHASDLWRALREQQPAEAYAPSRYSQALIPFMKYLDRCTSRDDRLMMTNLFPEVYVLSDRGFAGGQIAFLEGFYASEGEQANTISRMQQQSVPFVLVVEGQALHMPRLMSYIEGRYSPMVHVEVPGTDGVQVLVDRMRRSARTDASTGWPCFQ